MLSPDKAVLLLSGGLDSATVAHMLKAHGKRIYALTFLYGQQHDVEASRALQVARVVGVEDHQFVDLPTALFRSSSLVDPDQKVPKDGLTDEIPSTYVPARNVIFLSMALAYAETIGASEIYIGVNAVDYSGYPDCRPEAIEAFEDLANIATKTGAEEKFRVMAPLMYLSKREIISKGLSFGIDYAMTTSCYDPPHHQTGDACGLCDACRIRLAAFKEVGISDPVRYAEGAA